MNKISLVRELAGYFIANRKWWLVPIFIVLAFFSLFIALAAIFPSGPAVTPLIYAIF